MTRTVACAALALSLFIPSARGDEGMWLYNAFPAARVQASYGFTPSQAWLDHVRLSSLRFPGGSGAFVSPDGLVATNHHIARGCVSNLSSKEHDYMNEGFVAASRSDEKTCPGMELSQLMSIERVTARLRAVEKPEMSAAEAEAARKMEMAAIEKACSDETGLRCDVVTLYSGREFDLYRYRRYTDVRLAFAPATQMAQYGGDNDNFEFPRYSTDFALLRVYADGRPVQSPEYLRFTRRGVGDGDFVAVSGNPGSTGRLLTVAERAFLRDVQYPLTLLRLNTVRDAMVRYGSQGAEQKRIARDELRGVENTLKATAGYLSGLLDESLMAAKAKEEAELRAAVAKDPALAARIGDPWSSIVQALAVRSTFYARQSAVDAVAGAGNLAGYARTLVRLAHQRVKPSGERLREYRDTVLPQVHNGLAADVPIYPDYEEAVLGAALRMARSQLGPLHPIVRATMSGRPPEEVAHEAVAGTRLGDPAVRLELEKADTATLEASTDPMIRLALAFEPLAMALRLRGENEVDAVEKPAAAKVADAYFAVRGTSVYPDATFTLRLSYGKVGGLRQDGAGIPWATRIGGYFERSASHGDAPPYNLPPALAAAKGKLALDTPLDFATNHDIIGGNSGSPVVDRNGDFVGVIFDGNVWGLPNRFAFDAERSRAIAVDARAMLEVLRQVYPAAHLAAELVKAGAAK
jgi:hypothetical protein